MLFLVLPVEHWRSLMEIKKGIDVAPANMTKMMTLQQWVR